MVNLVEVKKLARKHFDPEMKKRGFVRTPKRHAYYRKVNDIYHIFWMENVMGGSNRMRVVVTAWVPEWAVQPFDTRNIANGVFINTGGRLSPHGPSDRHVEIEWPITTQQDVASSLVKLIGDLDRFAIPWLDRIADRESLVRHIRPLNATDRFGNRAADQVYGRNMVYRGQHKMIGEK